MHIDENNANDANIPIEAVEKISKYLARAASIAEQFDCSFFTHADYGIALHQNSKMFTEETAGGVAGGTAILDVKGPFVGGEYWM